MGLRAWINGGDKASGQGRAICGCCLFLCLVSTAINNSPPGRWGHGALCAWMAAAPPVHGGPGEAAGGGGGRSPVWCLALGPGGLDRPGPLLGRERTLAGGGPEPPGLLRRCLHGRGCPGLVTRSPFHAHRLRPAGASAWDPLWQGPGPRGGGPAGAPHPSLGHRLLPREDRVRPLCGRSSRGTGKDRMLAREFPAL